MEGAAHLRNAGVERSASLRNQPLAHFSSRPLRVRAHPCMKWLLSLAIIALNVGNNFLVLWLCNLVIAPGQGRAGPPAQQPVWRPALHFFRYLFMRSRY